MLAVKPSTVSWRSFLLGSSLWYLLSCTGGERSPAFDPPNVLLVLADDLGYSDVGYFGSEIETPTLDRLAKQGWVFTRFYNAAKCSPSRAALLTGQYPHRAGVGDVVALPDRVRPPGPYQGYLASDSVLTIAEVLRSAGYATYMSGKWHVGEAPEHWPTTRGFDGYFGLISGASSYFEMLENEARPRVFASGQNPWRPPLPNFYLTDALVDSTLQFLDRHHDRSPTQPWFVYVAFTAPHWPLHAPEAAIEAIEFDYSVGWDSLWQQRRKNQLAQGIGPDDCPTARPSSVPAWDALQNPGTWSELMRVYAAMVNRMDQQLGRLIDHLYDTGQLDNTLILVLSDNGASAEDISQRGLHQQGARPGTRGSYLAYQEPWARLSNAPFRNYKLSLLEGGISTPCLLIWPKGGVTHRHRIEATHLIDIFPTILDACAVEYPARYRYHRTLPLPGLSLWKADSVLASRPLFWEYKGQAAVQQNSWKALKLKDAPWALYNLTTDRCESSDLAEQAPGRLRKLVGQWNSWAEDVGVHASRKAPGN